MKNLNNIVINTLGDKPTDMTMDNSASFDQVKNVTVLFRNLKQNLIRQIEESDIVFGCVAWLTDPDILDALATKQVLFLVQKEDFLRPDFECFDRHEFTTILQSKYQKLRPFGWHVANLDAWTPLADISTGNGDDAEWGPVRCIGNYNANKYPAFPRMHNKFAVFCKYEQSILKYSKEQYQEFGKQYILDSDNDDFKSYSNEELEKLGKKFLEYDPKLGGVAETIVAPKTYWTGSFNFTKNSGYSFENAVVIKDKKVAEIAFKEFCQLFPLSEPLDWESPWIEPTLRIGT